MYVYCQKRRFKKLQKQRTVQAENQKRLGKINTHKNEDTH